MASEEPSLGLNSDLTLLWGAADKMKRSVSTEGPQANTKQDRCGKAWQQFALQRSLLHFQKETMCALLLEPRAYHSLRACSTEACLDPQGS